MVVFEAVGPKGPLLCCPRLADTVNGLPAVTDGGTDTLTPVTLRSEFPTTALVELAEVIVSLPGVGSVT
jgi:hypothetical protein